MLPYSVQVNCEEAWCVSCSEWCGCAMAFYVACQRHMMVQHCSESGSTNKLFCRCFLLWQEDNEVILNVWLFWMTMEGVRLLELHSHASLNLSMVAVAQALTSHMHDCIERSSSRILSGGANICNCKSSENEWCVIECETIMEEKG